MITIDRSTPLTPNSASASKPLKAQPASRAKIVETEEAGKQSYIPSKDRRKNGDRRRQQKNIVLDSRSGKDRRKSFKNKNRSIDINA